VPRGISSLGHVSHLHWPEPHHCLPCQPAQSSYELPRVIHMNFHVSVYTVHIIATRKCQKVLPCVSSCCCHIILLTPSTMSFSVQCHVSIHTTTCHPATLSSILPCVTLPCVTSVLVQLNSKMPKMLDTCHLLVLPHQPVDVIMTSC